MSVSKPEQPLYDGYLARAPSVAVEVLSPSNRAVQIERKLTLHFSEGAEEVWVLDPSRRSMTVYSSSGDKVDRLAVQERYTSDSLGVTIVLADLFGANQS